MNIKKQIIILIIIISCLGCDQFTKKIVLKKLQYQETISLFNDTFRLQYGENKGAFLSMFSGQTKQINFWILAVIPGLFLILLFVYISGSKKLSNFEILGFSLILGGGLGNIIDRLFNDGKVIDFMNFGIGNLRTGILNVADLAITFGVVIVLSLQFREWIKKRE